MSIAVFGVNHRTAPLEVRERFAHAARDVPGSLERVLAAGAGGGGLLSTCNRTEFYLNGPADTVPGGGWAVRGERAGVRRVGGGAASARPAAVTLAGKIFNRLAGRSALILGAGDMAELAATCLASEGVRVTLVANRSYERAQAIAEALGARALSLDEAWEHFGEADIVLTSTAAPHAVVTWERVASAIARRGDRP